MSDETPETDGAETDEAALRRTTRELAIAAEQRQFLMEQLHHRIERFHALRIVAGDVRAVQLVPLVNSELDACNQVLGGIHAKHTPGESGPASLPAEPDPAPLA